MKTFNPQQTVADSLNQSRFSDSTIKAEQVNNKCRHFIWPAHQEAKVKRKAYTYLLFYSPPIQTEQLEEKLRKALKKKTRNDKDLAFTQ